WASIDQYSSGVKFSISFSRSITIFKATDCTLPALNPFFTFFHNNGLILYPTKRSKILLACCASTKSVSIARLCLNDSLLLSFFFLLNTTLHSYCLSTFKLYYKF